MGLIQLMLGLRGSDVVTSEAITSREAGGFK